MKKVMLGLSGGVDSAVAAALLRQDGYEVLGVYLDIGIGGGEADARAVAETIDVPLVVKDIRDDLQNKVCAPFIEAYFRGETPNPCIMCNPAVKFRAIIEAADAAGAQYIATGHYARVRRDGGRAQLLQAASSNDQSYMLCRLLPEQLDRLLLPLGELEKDEVRKLAEGFSLPVAHKPDSMEICFIPDGDYGAYLEQTGRAPAPGNFVDEAGNVLGRHRGIHRYTLGQRRGLGVSAGRRVFVSEIRVAENEIVLSDGNGLYVTDIAAKDVNWLTEPMTAPFTAEVKIRHSKAQTMAELTPHPDGTIAIHFVELVRAPTAGQSAAFYQENILLGGAYIL